MNLALVIGVGLKEISAHKFRSFLTMLGIILGVCSLVGMFALVAGMTEGLRAALIEAGGLEKINVIDQDVPEHQEHLAGRSLGRTWLDVEAIRRHCPLIELVSPEVHLYNVRVVRGAHSWRLRELTGATEAYLTVDNHRLRVGRFLTDLDLARAHKVCIIGTRVRDALFPDDDSWTGPLGQRIEIAGQPFTIVGVFDRYESEPARKRREAGQTTERARERRGPTSGRRSMNWFEAKNDTIIIPVTTMRLIFRSAARADGAVDPRLTELNLRVADPQRLNEALQQVRNVLLFTHQGVEDFGFNTREDWADRIHEQTANAIRTGGLIAIISLIVGGIGIMNIMLASISERIHEIGIRQAVGARQQDVFLQILTESVVLAMLGGVVGLVAAFGLVKLLALLAPFDFTPVVRVPALAVSFLFSAIVGVLAGLYPAIKAARLDPIAALRYE